MSSAEPLGHGIAWNSQTGGSWAREQPSRAPCSAAGQPGWVYAAQPAIPRHGTKTAPLRAGPRNLGRGPGSFSAGRSKSTAALSRPQTATAPTDSGTERSFGRPLTGTPGRRLSASISAAAIDALRPSHDDRRQQMARVSALAMQAERAAKVLRESIATRSALRDQVEQGENLLRMRHESAVAYERAAHTALRQLDEAETAAARAAERAAALLAAADDVEIASDPRSATERCVELEEGAARVLLEMGERVARAHEDGLFAAAVRVGQAGATSGDGFETGGEEVSKIKAAVLASADAVVAALHAVRTRAGAAAAAERPNASAALERASADDDDDDESPVYPAALAHAPWIEVNTRSWAVLLPAQADAGGSDRDSEPDDADDAAADGGARARSGGAGAQERGDEGGGEEEEEGGAGGPALRAMPIEALSRQHAALSSRLVEMRAAARSLEAEVRAMSQASQFETIDADRDGLITIADARPHASDWGVPPAVLERAFSGAVLPLRGGRGRMDWLDFESFVEWVEDGGQSAQGLRAWVRCLDLDGDGAIGPADLHAWYTLVHAPAATADSHAEASPPPPVAPPPPPGTPPRSGSLRAFGRVDAAHRPEAHVDTGGGDTPRRPDVGAVDVPPAEGAEATPGAAAEEPGGKGSFADLVCQLVDMVSAGSAEAQHVVQPHRGPRKESPISSAQQAVSALTYATLYRCKIAPAVLQLLLTPSGAMK